MCVCVIRLRSWLATSRKRWTSRRSWSAAACVRQRCPSRTTNKQSVKTVTCGSGTHIILFHEFKSNPLKMFFISFSLNMLCGVQMPQLSLTGHELNLNAKCLLWRFIYLHRAVIKPPTFWYLPIHHTHHLINILCQIFLPLVRMCCLWWALRGKSVPVSWTSVLFLLYFCVCVWVCVYLCVHVSVPASQLSNAFFSRSPPGVCCHTRPARRWRSDVASCWIASPDCHSLRVSATFHLSSPPFHSLTLHQPSPPVTFNVGPSSRSVARKLHT